MPPILLALIFGPADYARAGYKRRAIISAGIAAVLALLVAYIPYLQIFAEVNWGGDSARDLFETSVLATLVWLEEAPRWLPSVVLTVLALNVVCAIDLVAFAQRGRGKTDSRTGP